MKTPGALDPPPITPGLHAAEVIPAGDVPLLRVALLHHVLARPASFFAKPKGKHRTI